jgi:hypothetical protein
VLRRRFPYDEQRTPSLDIRIQAKGGPYVDLTGIVDSGASTTVLSREHADKLGIAPGDLVRSGSALIANEAKVPRWAATVPIRAQVLRHPDVDVVIPWGPLFALKVMFFDHATPLWGQDDFFATFRTTLARDVDPAWFELIYQPED